MQLANVMVALAGDKGNTVPKDNVTPAEAAVLITIHGEGSVFDIDILEEELDISSRDMVTSLRERYRARNEDGDAFVDLVYPGRSPNLHRTFADLELDDSAYKATGHATPETEKDDAAAAAEAEAKAKAEAEAKAKAESADTKKSKAGNGSVLD